MRTIHEYPRQHHEAAAQAPQDHSPYLRGSPTRAIRTIAAHYTEPVTGQRVSPPTTFTTERAADDWLTTVRADIVRGVHRPASLGAITLRDYFERWLSQHPNLAEGTRVGRGGEPFTDHARTQGVELVRAQAQRPGSRCAGYGWPGGQFAVEPAAQVIGVQDGTHAGMHKRFGHM